MKKKVVFNTAYTIKENEVQTIYETMLEVKEELDKLERLYEVEFAKLEEMQKD